MRVEFEINLRSGLVYLQARGGCSDDTDHGGSGALRRNHQGLAAVERSNWGVERVN